MRTRTLAAVASIALLALLAVPGPAAADHGADDCDEDGDKYNGYTYVCPPWPDDSPVTGHAWGPGDPDGHCLEKPTGGRIHDEGDGTVQCADPGVYVFTDHAWIGAEIVSPGHTAWVDHGGGS